MAFGLDGSYLNPAGLLAVGTRLENEIAAAAYVAETGRDWVESLVIVRSAFTEADKVMKRKADSTPLFDGVLDLLQQLSLNNVKVGILSADSTANVQDFVERYQLGAFIQLEMGIDLGPSKPNPVLFYRACEALDVAPEAALMIGDSIADLEMAQAANAGGCVGATWGWTKAATLSKADALITSFTQVQIFS